MPTITGYVSLPDDVTRVPGNLYATIISPRDDGLASGSATGEVLGGTTYTSDTGSGLSLTLPAGWYNIVFESAGTHVGKRIRLGPWRYNLTADITLKQILAAQPSGVPITPTQYEALSALIAAKPDLPTGGTDGQALLKSGNSLVWGTVSPDVPDATTDTAGKVRLASTSSDTTRVPLVSLVASMIGARVDAVIAGAPGLLDTLDELAAALGDDANFAATVTTALAGKQTIVRWDGSAWPARPAGAPFGVLFLSTNDPAATAPPSGSLLVGDVWRKHPDAT